MGYLMKILCFLSYLVIHSCHEEEKFDFRHISYPDLQLSFGRFMQPGITSYSQLLFDLNRNQVFVGARDALFRLSLPHMKLLENVTWPAPATKTKLCLTKGQSEENCHNYIKVLLTNGRQVFTCGTNSFSPICTWREIENLGRVIEEMDGVAKCPYNPLANTSALMLKTGDYYIGGPTDFSGSDFAIYRSISSVNVLRTKQYDSLWLNEPQFVGSFEHDKFIYFIFREAAVEYMNCGKIVYSRIARMCKNDPGGKLMLKDNWTTFLKARLNCSINGEYPFYFHDIQSISYVPEENVMYAVFTTAPNDIAGSAICAFNMTAINGAFSGPFKRQKHSGNIWEKHTSHFQDHFECRDSIHSRNLIEISKYQLMDNSVQATSLKPLYSSELERFTYLAVDVVPTKLHAAVHVMFVATTNGLIKKLTVLPRTKEVCVVEIWQALPNPHIQIKTMQYLKETKSIYLGTDKELLWIPAEHCRRHVSYDSCINAMDPYCGWNELEDACTTAPNGDPLIKYWKQGVTSCPILDAAVDGGWSSWSKWFPCTHRTSNDPDVNDECLCQTRQCNNPAPQNGGKQCLGATVAVTNCTVHGGWTMWSAWSECSATCGFAVKTRTRTCTNPAPAHGGRVCVGQDRSEVLCTGNPPCPAPTPTPINGKWSEWNEWEECSVPCGGGFRKRYRKCDSPPPSSGGLECIGCNVQYEVCNAHICPEQRKQTPWTHWYIMNSSSSKNEFVQRRFKYACRGPVPDPSQLKVTLYKEEERICREGQCYMNPYEEKWGPWSPWSDCSVNCGGGTQRRTRICEGRGECQGSGVQTKACNTHPCRSEWGCWSDWSPCSVTCGWGIRKRYRSCLGENCDGDGSEEEACEVQSCDSLLGWDFWTEWSLCDENQEQHRKRKCRTDNPGPNMCKGKSQETRICKGEFATWKLKETSTASAGIIIAYISIGYMICLVMAVLFYYFYLRKRKMRIPSSPHYMSAKQNPYISVPFQERPTKKQSASTSGSIINNVHSGTIKPNKYLDYENTTMKRNSHGLTNGHSKTADIVGDDKLYYD